MRTSITARKVTKRGRWRLPVIMLSCLIPGGGHAANNLLHHGDPIAPVILTVTAILFFALLGRFLARYFHQPSVLGELIIGILLGNLLYFSGIDTVLVLREGTAIFNMLDLSLQGASWDAAAMQSFDPQTAQRVIAIMESAQGAQLLQVSHVVDIFSRYGVIFLLFLVGLETSIDEMRQVSGDSLRVAIIGMIAPVSIGFVSLHILMPELSLNTNIFVAATLSATSIGITASVLKELGQLHRREAHIILGAAVMDDIFSLIILTIVTGIVVSGSLAILDITMISLTSTLFLIGTIILGPRLLRFAIKLVRHLDLLEAKLFISFIFVMVLSWLSNLAGLATIVGAFTAGLILQDAYFKHWGDLNTHRLYIKDLVAPLEAIMVPIFFVLMGLQVKLEAFLETDIMLAAVVLLLAATTGKILSAAGVSGKSNRLAVGMGMMPRGEVGLIFVSIGKTLGVINDKLFSATVLMIIVTTLATPPLLKLVLQQPAPETDR